MIQEGVGYDKNRFINLHLNTFDCLICHSIARSPQECNRCGFIFCTFCIQKWHQRKRKCPNKCGGEANLITSIALLRIYQNFDIKCQGYENCQSIIKLSDLEKHEKQHKMTIECSIFQSQRILRDENIFRWNRKTCGRNIEISNDDCMAWIRKCSGHQTVISDKPIMSGIHYWEIQVNRQSKMDLGIGVATTNNLNFNNFITQGYGFTYVGVGAIEQDLKQFMSIGLSATTYSRKNNVYKGRVGVYLNMEQGQLKYYVNNKYTKIYYKAQQLQKGPIFPAICIMSNCGGSIHGPLPIPEFDQ